MANAVALVDAVELVKTRIIGESVLAIGSRSFLVDGASSERCHLARRRNLALSQAIKRHHQLRRCGYGHKNRPLKLNLFYHLDVDAGSG
ncbi:hypothetical protein D3C77_609070 [compost metagenome]